MPLRAISLGSCDYSKAVLWEHHSRLLMETLVLPCMHMQEDVVSRYGRAPGMDERPPAAIAVT